MLDHALAPLDRLARDNRIAVTVAGGAGVEVAFGVAVELEELRRERVAQIVENVFAGRDVAREIGPFRGRDLLQAPLQQRLLVETTCSAMAWPASRSRAIAAMRVGHFHRREQMIE